MPYIERKKRPKPAELAIALSDHIRALPEDEQDGTLNFAITTMLKRIYPLKYRHLNRAVGVLEAVKLEFYRHIVGPYEQEAIERNGDI